MGSSGGVSETERYSETDIAIVGMALRAPGARNVREFWRNLRSGTSSIRRLSSEELEASGEPASRTSKPNYVPFTADLPDMEMFDAEFFGLSPKEAAIMDPQHRHFLECVWEALEDAGRPPESAPGPVGVFAGCGMGGYFYFNVCSRRELVDEVGMFLLRHTGNDKDFLATRASFAFDLQGPSVNVQTACSTSLVATHYACQSLLSHECDMALAGGVTIELPHRRGYLYESGEILSPDGCCRAFDHRAAGTVFGSGVGVVALRRLSDALADGDPIHAVIKAMAINNDGRAKAGYLAPSVDGQAKAVIEAQALAGVGADEIGYVECHGTGTPIGDPIEIDALTRAFRRNTARTGFCRVGSVKTNIGHLDTAAGVVGLIKAALSLEHGEIPPTLGFEAPNPDIPFASSPFVVNDRLTPWPRGVEPRYAAVNSLGVGGTNAHAILQEAPPLRRPVVSIPDDEPRLIVLSARSRKALDASAMALAAQLESAPELRLPDVAHTLFSGRRHFDRRRVLAARGRQEAIELLRSAEPRRVHSHARVEGEPRAVFVFPGGGAQHPGMGRRLYEGDASFRATIDEGLSYLPAAAAEDIRALWLGARREDPAAARLLLRPSLQLPAILIVEVALARLWMARGLRPAALIGHSMGENAAACVGGVLSFRDAVSLVRLRGELFDEVSGGGMLSVALGADELGKRLPAELDLASVNAPDLCVASGSDAELATFQAKLTAEGVEATRVAIDIAAHSRQLEPILGRFEAFLRGLTLNAPEIPIVSNLTGTWLTDAEARDPLYWTRHLRSTVYFADGLATLATGGPLVYVEVGPGKTLSSLVKAQGAVDASLVINSLPHAQDADADDRSHLVAAFGRAWATGLKIDLDGLFAGADRQRVPLPTYPFQRQRYFIERAEAFAEAPERVLARRPDMADWGSRPVWRQAPAPIAEQGDGEPRDWLVFLDDAGVGDRLSARLRNAGQGVATVRAADQFRRRERGDYLLCPEAGRAGYDALVSALKLDGMSPDRILHCWLLTADESFRPGSSFFHRNQERGFFSLFFLAQALGEEPAAPLHVTVVTNGVQKIGERGVRYPEKATVFGPARVTPKEMPGVTVRLVDLELPAEPVLPATMRLRRSIAARLNGERRQAARDDDAIELLWEDLASAPATETIAYHGGRRWRQEHEPIQLRPCEPAEFRQRGVYFVTGGVGDLALAVCEELARRFKPRLVLFGRTCLPDRPFWPGYLRMHGPHTRVGRCLSAIERLEALGAEVLYVAGDVANPEDVRAAAERAAAAFGPVNGVIHAAGVIDDDLIQLKTPEDLEAVLAPKVQGAANLAAVFGQAELDLFVLFSSTSVVTAPAGQVDYVAANAYLDAFAESWDGREGGRMIAIQWGVWSEIGLAARATQDPSVRAADAHEGPTSGPLFERWAGRVGGPRWLEAEWGPQNRWMLDEHRLVTGEAILPGAGYVEIAAEVMREHGFDGPFEIRNLEFLSPLYVEDGDARRVRAELRILASGFALEVTSAARDGAVFAAHGRARLDALSGSLPQRLDLEAIAARCGAPRSTGSTAMRSAQEDHLAFGPRWSVLRSVAFGDQEAIATLELNPRFASDRKDGYRQHAGLLDIATGYAMELVPGYDMSDGLWAPLSYDRIRIHRDLPAHVRSWARLRGERGATDGFASFDVTIVDEDGEVACEVEALTVRLLGRGFNLADAASSHRAAAPADLGRDARASASTTLAEVVANGIRPAEGADAMFRAIGTGARQVVVSSIDLDVLKRRSAAPPLEAPGAAAFDRPELDSDFVPPATETERIVAGFWSQLLGIEAIGIKDDFFALGGHSLIAVRLFRMIREAFAVDLPISALFDAPTIERCAATIEARGGRSINAVEGGASSREPAAPAFLHVVPMTGRERPGATPFFLCAGMFGNVLNLRHLSLLLGADRQVFGLQARGLYGDLTPHETFEEAARDYCAELRAVQPRGPYLLGGFSGGGLTAYAMAQRLAAEGEEIAALVLLDTPLPRQTPLSVGDLVSLKWQDIDRQRGAFLRNWAAKRARWELGRLRHRFSAPAQVETERFNDAAIEAAFYRALSRFVVEPYRGPVALFRPRPEVAYLLSNGRRLDHNRHLLLEDNGWSPFVRDLAVVEVPGDHDAMVLEPNVRVLADRIRSLLGAADERSGRLFAAE